MNINYVVKRVPFRDQNHVRKIKTNYTKFNRSKLKNVKVLPSKMDRPIFFYLVTIIGCFYFESL